MKSLTAVSFFCTAILVSSCSANNLAVTGSPAPAPVRVLVWNVENYTDAYDDPYINNSREDAGASKDATALQRMAAVIQASDADVLALQEIEGDRALSVFLDEYLPGHGYEYFASVPSMNWFQNTAVASRVPLGPMVSFREVDMYNAVSDETVRMFNNRLGAVEVRPNDTYSFWLVNLHLKAGRGEENEVWRTEQIAILHEWFDELEDADPETNVLVAGDMNFYPDSGEYAAMVAPVDGTFQLANPFVFENATDTLTHPADNPERQLDYAFVNQALRPEYVPGSLHVFKPFGPPEMRDVSDHLPLLIDIVPRD